MAWAEIRSSKPTPRLNRAPGACLFAWCRWLADPAQQSLGIPRSLMQPRGRTRDAARGSRLTDPLPFHVITDTWGWANRVISSTGKARRIPTTSPKDLQLVGPLPYISKPNSGRPPSSILYHHRRDRSTKPSRANTSHQAGESSWKREALLWVGSPIRWCWESRCEPGSVKKGLRNL